MTVPTIVHHDTTVTENAVLCADGRIHFGPDFLRGEDAELVRSIADRCSGESYCGGGPHYLATRKRITTAWTPSVLPSAGARTA